MAECKKTTFGRDYHGTLNMSITGDACQRWDSDDPHASAYPEDYNFPWDGGVEVFISIFLVPNVSIEYLSMES